MESIPFLLLAGILLSAFFGIAYASQKISFPSVLLIILFGVVAGTYLTDDKILHLVAEIGIVLLFFVLGMEFPIAKVIEIGKRVWPAGLMDVVLNFLFAFIVARMFSLDTLSALVVGGICYASSSSITAKLLEEKKRLANQETEFILALLIFEDLVAPVLVSLLVGLSRGDQFSAGMLVVLLAKILLLIVGAVVIGYYGFRRLSAFVSKYMEKDFMPLFAVGIALLYSGFALYLGLSEILGAFLAGVMLSETGKSREVEHVVFPVRDLTLPFFFFWFGTSIDLGEGIPFLGMMIILIAISIAGKLAVGFYGGQLFGLTKKVATRAGFSLVQRGEFSIIIASLGGTQLKVFGGVYVLITALIGTYFFSKAPVIAKSVNVTKVDKADKDKIEKKNEKE